jgi:hypothetical protein
MSNKMSSSLKNYMNGSVKNEIRNEVNEGNHNIFDDKDNEV